MLPSMPTQQRRRKMRGGRIRLLNQGGITATVGDYTSQAETCSETMKVVVEAAGVSLENFINTRGACGSI